MDLLKQTKEFCRLHNIKPARTRGQNFLIKEEVYEKVIEAAELKKSDIVLEVGPGLGFLTIRLAERAGRVIAVELDDKLAEVLQVGLEARGVENVEVVNENILDFRFQIYQKKLKIKNFKVVANLPYNITSVFLRKVLSLKNKPELIVLMLQKEVAERIVARPPQMSRLAISVQFYAKPEVIQIVPASNFWPRPEVDSAIIKLRMPNAECRIDEKNFFRLVKIGFSAKRKMLKNNLAAGFHIDSERVEEKLKKAGFSPKIRAQELAVKDWKTLLKYF